MPQAKIPEGITVAQLNEIYQKLDAILAAESLELLTGPGQQALAILCLNDSDDNDGNSPVHVAWAESKALAEARTESGQIHPGLNRFGDRCSGNLFRQTVEQTVQGEAGLAVRWREPQTAGGTARGKLTNNVVRRLYQLEYQVNIGIKDGMQCVGSLGIALGKTPNAAGMGALLKEMTAWGDAKAAVSQLVSYLQDNFELNGPKLTSS